MGYGMYPYGGVAYAGSDVAQIPTTNTKTVLAVEWSPTTSALDTPVWVDITGDVRSWTTSRGRNRELERFQPGRATVVLANRERQYDSVYAAGPNYGNVQPMKRIRIRETFNGVTYPVFDGFVDKWKLDYPNLNKDATATVTATDAFKVLARTALPISVYDKTVRDDAPVIYWRFDEKKTAESDAALVALNGGSLGTTGNASYVGPPKLGGEALVVKDPGSSMVATNSIQVAGSQNMGASIANASFNLMGSSFVVELWCIPEYEQASNIWLWEADSPGGSSVVQLRRGGTTFTFGRTNTAGTTINLNSAGTEVNQKRYHIVCRHVFGEPTRMWINGTLFTGSTSTGAFDSDAPLRVAHPATPAGVGQGNWQGPISHFAVYTGATAEAIDQTWVDRHYAAGTTPWNGDLPGARLGRVLDLALWPAAGRELDAGITTLQSAELGSQAALEHSQKVGETEFGLLFINRAGNVRFVGRTALFARVVGTATYGDQAAQVGYRDFVPDDGDEVIRNVAKISRLNGIARTSTNATSRTAYGPFEYVLEGLLHQTDTYSTTYGTFIVAEYGVLKRRVTSLTVGPPISGQESIVYPAMLGPELGDVIAVTHTPLGGGAAFTQTCAIEGIQASGAPGGVRTTTFTLSPGFTQGIF